jgi:hypothetical protein
LPSKKGWLKESGNPAIEKEKNRGFLIVLYSEQIYMLNKNIYENSKKMLDK